MREEILRGYLDMCVKCILTSTHPFELSEVLLDNKLFSLNIESFTSFMRILYCVEEMKVACFPS